MDFCASFGSLYGNDAYNTFGYAHCFCLSKAANCPLLIYYVDNYVNVTPFCGKGTRARALVELSNLKRELIASGLLFHQFEGPTTRITFLGWDIDTDKMTISIPEARHLFMISFLEEWEKKEVMSIADLSSIIGLLIFLSQMINGMKATIGILILKRNKMNRSVSVSSPVSRRVKWAIAHLLYVLKRWKGIARIYVRAWTDKQADITIYCAIALEKEPKASSFGKGALILPTMQCWSEKWVESELAEAWRDKKHSTTHLELMNMFNSVLRFSSSTQKVLCICDKTAVEIATARYSAAGTDILRRDYKISM